MPEAEALYKQRWEVESWFKVLNILSG